MHSFFLSITKEFELTEWFIEQDVGSFRTYKQFQVISVFQIRLIWKAGSLLYTYKQVNLANTLLNNIFTNKHLIPAFNLASLLVSQWYAEKQTLFGAIIWDVPDSFLHDKYKLKTPHSLRNVFVVSMLHYPW